MFSLRTFFFLIQKLLPHTKYVNFHRSIGPKKESDDDDDDDVTKYLFLALCELGR